MLPAVAEVVLVAELRARPAGQRGTADAASLHRVLQARQSGSGPKRQGVVTVCPITSNVARVCAFEVRVEASGSSGLEVDSKIQANQVQSVDIAYIGDRIGDLTPSQQAQLENALRLHLQL